MTLEEAIERAAAELPEGASVVLSVERDAAYVAVHWDNHYRTAIDGADQTLAEQVLAGIEWCKVQPPANG